MATTSNHGLLRTISRSLDIRSPGETRLSAWGQIRRARLLYLLILPTLVGMVMFHYYPAAKALYYSFTDWNGRTADYIGLANFTYFFNDPKLVRSWMNVFQLLVANLLKVLTLPLLVAYCIAHMDDKRSAYIYRVLFVIPVVIPGFVNTLFWRWILSWEGLVNYILKGVGLDFMVTPWLGKSATALYALMFIGFPWVPAVTMLIYLAGFLSISNEVLDAAVVDGANTFTRFWFVELPQIFGQIKLFIILTINGTIQDFWQILYLTDGGPGYTTTLVPALRMYKAFMTENYQFGYASSIGVVLFTVILILTLLNMRFLRSTEEEVARGVL